MSISFTQTQRLRHLSNGHYKSVLFVLCSEYDDERITNGRDEDEEDEDLAVGVVGGVGNDNNYSALGLYGSGAETVT